MYLTCRFYSILFGLGLVPREAKLDSPTVTSRLTNEMAQIKKVQATQITLTKLKISPNGDSYSVTLSPGPPSTPWQVEVGLKIGLDSLPALERQ